MSNPEPTLHDALERVGIPSHPGGLERTLRAVTPRRRRRRPLVWFGACVAAVALAVSPVGPATADFVRDNIGSGSEVVCPEAQSAYADAGITVETFSPDCPTSAEIQQTLAVHEQLDAETNAVRAAAEAPFIDLRERIINGEELNADVNPSRVLAVIDSIVGPGWDDSQGVHEAEATAVVHQLRAAGDLPPPGSVALSHGEGK